MAELNRLAREQVRAGGGSGLGAGPGKRGGVAVKNGTLGTVLAVEAKGERLTVRLDGPGRRGGTLPR